MTDKTENHSEVFAGLTDGQILLIGKLAESFRMPYKKIARNAESDIVADKFLNDFGDYLRIHHSFSKQPFTKDKFEFAIEEVCNMSNIEASLAPTGNPGHDITIRDQRVSLKTQADRSIKEDVIHISKFMELGKGQWGKKVDDLVGLREQFFSHMKSYQRIFTLRCLKKENGKYHYELVEIPTDLLLEAKKGSLRMMENSKQMPRPGYCDIKDEKGNIKFQLYFDGGGERKLQIKGLKKDNCIVHAEWAFDVQDL
jgi:type II restriction enzyme